mmetsp:Transcript_129212/g.224268  ORF Transcript_129212/g.224268 Transcript_129212/m.224268 type:complete len:318 (+) Transcript_129212:1671-2624(+)
MQAGEMCRSSASKAVRRLTCIDSRLGEAHSTTAGSDGSSKSRKSSVSRLSISALKSPASRGESTRFEAFVSSSRSRQLSRQAVAVRRPSETRATKNAATTAGAVKDKQCPTASSSTATSESQGAARNSPSARQISGKDSPRKRGAASRSSSTTASAAASPRTPSAPGSHAASARSALCQAAGSPPVSSACKPAAAALQSPRTRTLEVLGGLTKKDFSRGLADPGSSMGLSHGTGLVIVSSPAVDDVESSRCPAVWEVQPSASLRAPPLPRPCRGVASGLRVDLGDAMPHGTAEVPAAVGNDGSSREAQDGDSSCESA